MSFRISISFCYFWLVSFDCCGYTALCCVCCGVASFCTAPVLQVYCDPPGSRMLSGCAAYIGSRAYYAVDLIGDGYFFIIWVVGVFCCCSGLFAYNYIKYSLNILRIYPNNLSKWTFSNQKSMFIYIRRYYKTIDIT